MRLMGPIDPSRLLPALGPGADPLDVFWILQDLRGWLDDPFAAASLRSRLIEHFGSGAVVLMNSHQALIQISLLIQAGWLKPDGAIESRVASSSLKEADAPAPPPAAKKAPPAAPAPAPAAAPVTERGPAASARIEAAKSGVPFWECCEACGF